MYFQDSRTFYELCYVMWCDAILNEGTTDYENEMLLTSLLKLSRIWSCTFIVVLYPSTTFCIKWHFKYVHTPIILCWWQILLVFEGGVHHITSYHLIALVVCTFTCLLILNLRIEELLNDFVCLGCTGKDVTWPDFSSFRGCHLPSMQKRRSMCPLNCSALHPPTTTWQ